MINNHFTVESNKNAFQFSPILSHSCFVSMDEDPLPYEYLESVFLNVTSSRMRIPVAYPLGDILFKKVKEFLHAVVEERDEEDVINLIQYSYIGNCRTFSSV